jgi:hypothetical protein
LPDWLRFGCQIVDVELKFGVRPMIVSVLRRGSRTGVLDRLEWFETSSVGVKLLGCNVAALAYVVELRSTNALADHVPKRVDVFVGLDSLDVLLVEEVLLF